MFMNFRLYPFWLAAVLLFVLIALSACQKQGAPSGVKSYASDGLLGISDVNPNMPMSPTYHTYQKDTDLMEATIKQIPAVIDSNIRLNGPDVKVSLYVPSDLSDQQIAFVEKEAYEKLSNAMPRYKMKVMVYRKSS